MNKVEKEFSSFSLDEKEAKNQGFAGLLAKNHSKSLNAINSPSDVS